MKERAFTSARMSSGACSFCACFGAFKVCEDFEATSGSVVFELFENVGLKNQSSRCKIEAFYFTRIAIQIRTKTRWDRTGCSRFETSTKGLACSQWQSSSGWAGRNRGHFCSQWSQTKPRRDSYIPGLLGSFQYVLHRWIHAFQCKPHFRHTRLRHFELLKARKTPSL